MAYYRSLGHFSRGHPRDFDVGVRLGLSLRNMINNSGHIRIRTNTTSIHRLLPMKALLHNLLQLPNHL